MQPWRLSVCALGTVALCLAAVLSGLVGTVRAGDTVPRMEATDLLARLDSPDLLIIDVRRGKDWDNSTLMIKNSVRREYDDVDGWADALPRGKTLVLYCA